MHNRKPLIFCDSVQVLYNALSCLLNGTGAVVVKVEEHIYDLFAKC